MPVNDPVHDGTGEDPLLGDLIDRSRDITRGLAHSAQHRIERALAADEIDRLRGAEGVWAEFLGRQMSHELRLFSPFRDSERAMSVATAVHDQLRLASSLPSDLERMVRLVREHGLAVREIALALGLTHAAVVDALREAFNQLERLSDRRPPSL